MQSNVNVNKTAEKSDYQLKKEKEEAQAGSKTEPTTGQPTDGGHDQQGELAEKGQARS